MYHLAPHLNKADWSPEEDQRIIEAVEHDGTAWAKLVQYFPGRTDNGIKNRWNTLIRKRLRRELRHTEAAAHAVAIAQREQARLAGEQSIEAGDILGSVQGMRPEDCPAPPARRPGVPTTAAAAIAQQRVVVQRASSSSSSAASAMRRQERARHELDMRAADAARAAAAAAEAAALAYMREGRAASEAANASNVAHAPQLDNRCPCGRVRINIGDAWICTQHGDGSCFGKGSRKRPRDQRQQGDAPTAVQSTACPAGQAWTEPATCAAYVPEMNSQPSCPGGAQPSDSQDASEGGSALCGPTVETPSESVVASEGAPASEHSATTMQATAQDQGHAPSNAASASVVATPRSALVLEAVEVNTPADAGADHASSTAAKAKLVISRGAAP